MNEQRRVWVVEIKGRRDAAEWIFCPVEVWGRTVSGHLAREEARQDLPDWRSQGVLTRVVRYGPTPPDQGAA